MQVHNSGKYLTKGLADFRHFNAEMHTLSLNMETQHILWWNPYDCGFSCGAQIIVNRYINTVRLVMKWKDYFLTLSWLNSVINTISCIQQAALEREPWHYLWERPVQPFSLGGKWRALPCEAGQFYYRVVLVYWVGSVRTADDHRLNEIINSAVWGGAEKILRVIIRNRLEVPPPSLSDESSPSKAYCSGFILVLSSVQWWIIKDYCLCSQSLQSSPVWHISRKLCFDHFSTVNDCL